MGYDVEITRNPLFSRKPGPKITLDEWFNVIRRDPELKFFISADAADYGVDTALWIAHPNGKESDSALWCCDGQIVAKYPDEPLLRKMIILAARLDADVVGDNGEYYELDEEGTLISGEIETLPAFKEQQNLLRLGSILYGGGSTKCDVFLTRIQEASYDSTTRIVPTAFALKLNYYSWYLGFITAINEKRTKDGAPLIQVGNAAERRARDIDFLIAYSEKHPDHTFYHAVCALVHHYKNNPAS
ncbi:MULTISPECIES: hypothetical protein [Acetobacter]|uniref:Uncharacterized protein n=2 Tax=Acetobacter TaxID=434 RepID=A0AAN1U8F3_9PROT|nr:MULTISPECIES: hypothetical protein [Acetobacter]ASL40900.1 hypothetical protein CBI36_11070 [Acetobacter oryzifermentans]AXM99754.1 hypothetical protein CJF59_03735 [Acetobacter pomorum]KAA8391884.1 hypothetical protein FKW22_14045 [Acetobacter sp. DmW_125124]KAA8393717.1 hypothetical protein FKW20_14890 [Acetobacter sp. DmW_125127]KAA8394366.1 hypothetical protein FKW19_12715 [Acetobacter sp. DmW_125128]